MLRHTLEYASIARYKFEFYFAIRQQEKSIMRNTNKKVANAFCLHFDRAYPFSNIRLKL